MRFLLILISCLLLSHKSNACYSASQNRLFPLGLCPQGLVVLETQLERAEARTNTEEMVAVWQGPCYFIIYDAAHKPVHKQAIDTLEFFYDANYDSIVNTVFIKGLALARNLPGFISATPVSITFCDYQESCSQASLLVDTLANKVFITLHDKTKHEVDVLDDPISIAENLLNRFTSYDDYGPNLYVDFINNIFLNSVRQFKIGDKLLTVVHIGTGQTFELADGTSYPPGKEYKADFAFTQLEKSVYNEPVLHHGDGFDFFVLQ